MTLADVHDGARDGRTIGLRHDCDDNGLASLKVIATWEAQRSRRSTFYLLHTAEWWATQECVDAARFAAELGHEVGLHHNALTVWWNTGRDPFDVFEAALDQLRSWLRPVNGGIVRSVAGHGDQACYDGRFVNYTMFGMDAGSKWTPFEKLTGMQSRSIAEFGLDFHGDHVPRSMYISDSGGEWTHDLADVVRDFPFETNTVILQHPDWYGPELFR